MTLTREQVVPHVIDALWRRGELSWMLRPGQLLLLAGIMTATVQIIVGCLNRRHGKSFVAVLYAITMCLRGKRTIQYGTAYLTDLQKFILPAFALILQTCPADLKPRYMPSKKIWVFPNGSVIELVGLDKNPDGLRGNNIDIIIVDEAGFVAHLKHLYTSVIIPATMSRENIKMIFISTPPESPAHFFVDLMKKAEKEPNGFFLKLTIDDMTDLPAAERERMLNEVGGEFSVTARREFFCEILTDVTRALAPAWNKKRHVKEIDEGDIAWRYFGDTGGTRDKTVILKAGYSRSENAVYFADEISFPKSTPTSEIAKGFTEKFGEEIVYIDAHGQTVIDYQNNGLRVGSVQKRAELVGKTAFSAGLQLLQTELHNDRMLVSPKCELLIKTLDEGLTNKTRTEFDSTDELGHCDAVAAAIYGLRGVDKTTDLRPEERSPDVWYANKQQSQVSELQKLSRRK